MKVIKRMNFNFNEQLMSLFRNSMTGLRRALNQKLLAINCSKDIKATLSEKEYRRKQGQTVNLV